MQQISNSTAATHHGIKCNSCSSYPWLIFYGKTFNFFALLSIADIFGWNLWVNSYVRWRQTWDLWTLAFFCVEKSFWAGGLAPRRGHSYALEEYAIRRRSIKC